MKIRNIIKSAFIGILLNLSEPLPKYEKLMITNMDKNEFKRSKKG